MRTFNINGTFKSLLLAGCAGSVVIATPALAQQNQDADILNTPGGSTAQTDAGPQQNAIIVTGSRIQRQDFEANSPLVTVDDALLQQSSSAAIEQNLNRLPQFTPAQTPQAGADIQPTATNTPGGATISLRGIGANRNLVLIDGRRGTPGNATAVVDITTIPSAAIERVEIISGGASSTYGADAVAGVTNFILKKNFQGLELDGRAAITQEGDGFEYDISGIMGTDFDDGRGNISLAMSVNSREANLRSDRSWYQDLFRDPSLTGGSQYFINNPGVVLDGVNGNYAAGLTSLFPDARLSPNALGTTVFLDSQGNPFVNGSFFDAGGLYGARNTRYVNYFGNTDAVDGYNTKITDAGTLVQNNPNLFLVLPLTRYNFLARGNYEITDNIGMFGQAMFSHVETFTRNEPGPISGGWGVDINPTLLDRDQLPTGLWTLLDSREDPNAPFRVTGLLPGNRETTTDVMSYNVVAGLEGSIPDIGWTWDLSVNHGVSSTNAKQTGIYSLERLRTVMGAPNFGQGTVFQGNSDPAFGGFGASTATCTSGFNIFIIPQGGISQDCLEATRADLKNRTYTRQTIVEGNLQGKLIDLPAGEVRTAIGASYRELEFEFTNDTLTTQGRSFNDQALGIYPSGNSEGFFDVKEVYGELLIPVLSDIPAIQQLNLELGGRISDFSTTGTSYTYKALGDWEVTDWMRIRGGYNRAERAPNLAELYLARQQIFGTNNLGDLCSRANPGPFSANPANPAGNQVYQTCLAMMPNQVASDAYYVGGGGQTDNSTSGFAWPSAIGNPNLTPEKADTYTAGVVLSSPFSSPLLSRLRLTVDYYNISVKDAIGQQTPGLALRTCFDPALNPLVNTDPAAAAQTAACRAITRNSVNGGLDNIQLTYANDGRFRLSGIDAQLDWAGDIGPGRLGVNVQFNYLISFKAAELPVDPLVEFKGTQGPTSNGLNGGNYDYRVFTNVNYTVDGFMVGLQWQHLPSIEDATEALFPTPTVGAPSYNIFHLNSSYAATDDVTIRFGVDNIFNKAPPLIGYNPSNTNPLGTGNLRGGNLGTGFYDDNGRRFYIGANVRF